MKQEVKIILQLTLDCDTTLSKKEIEEKTKSAINFSKDDNIEVMMIDTIEIREEKEIYENE